MRRLARLALVLVVLVPSSAEGGRAPAPYPNVAVLVNATAPAQRPLTGRVCGATVIAPAVAVTAAHCVAAKRPSQLHLIAGATTLCEPTGTRVPVSDIAVHDEYDPGTQRYDVAVIHLARPVAAPSIELREWAPGATATGMVVARDVSSGGPCGFEKLEARGVPLDTCATLNRSDRPVDESSQTCARVRSHRLALCGGDSGTGVFNHGRLVGVISWSWRCAPGDYGLYARAADAAPLIAAGADEQQQRAVRTAGVRTPEG